jgi:hypothetical protein
MDLHILSGFLVDALGYESVKRARTVEYARWGVYLLMWKFTCIMSSLIYLGLMIVPFDVGEGIYLCSRRGVCLAFPYDYPLLQFTALPQKFHRPRLLTHGQIQQYLLTSSPNNHHPNVPTDLFDTGTTSRPRISQPAHNLLRLTCNCFQSLARHHLKQRDQAPKVGISVFRVPSTGQVYDLLHV